ncbi:MAG TPA: PP2C family protein-serine/threonine phosphatase, partial [Candidatus Acidoferrum sp.]
VNAGHNPPLVVRPRDGSCEMFSLQSEAMPVGISADAEFASTTFRLETNDVLVAYTDGITEAENRQGEFWGEERLQNLLRSCCRETPEQIIRCILEEVSEFADGQRQRDDVTLVVLTVQDGCDV